MFVAKQIFRVSSENPLEKMRTKYVYRKSCMKRAGGSGRFADDHARSGGGGRAVQFHLELTIDKRGRWSRNSAVPEF